MRRSTMQRNVADFGMDTISLAGPLEAKLAAVKAAGFGQVMMAARAAQELPQRRQLRQRGDVGTADQCAHRAAWAKVFSPGRARPWKSNSVTLSHSSPAPAFQPAPACGMKSGSQ